MQTAVLDTADSEDPVECPTEVPEMLIFRSEHLERTFWCGTWLGGCGGELTTKLCTDKVCHFAHKADPDAMDSPCRRRSAGAAGTGSADHLYIKAALADWMASHNTPGSTRIPQDPSGHVRLGAQVTAEPAGHLPLRFILDETAMPALGQSTAGMVFGENVKPPSRILREHGFVHRVRCVSDGAHRRTQIGTQGIDGTTDWCDLTADHVELTAHGLSTEASSEIRRRRTQTVLIGARARRQAAQDSTAPRPAATEPAQEVNRDELVANLRTALAEKAGVTLLQRHLDRLESAAHSSATLEETELMRRAHEVLMLLRRGVGAAPPAPTPRKRKTTGKKMPPAVLPLVRPRAIRPSRSSLVPEQTPQAAPKDQQYRQRQNISAAVREVRGLLRRFSHRQTATLENPEVRNSLSAALELAEEELSVAERRRAKALLARLDMPGQQSSGGTDGLSPQALRAAAVAVRGALKKAAREQRTTSWDRLKRQLGSALPSMTAAERVQVLTLVDQGAAAGDQPLLSVLVAAGDPAMAQAFQQVALHFGLAVPEDAEGLSDVIAADTEHAHRFWRGK
ncbi:hypothetical protein ACFRCI_41555 [Streptomyces sp. NPDC056638]|uniref:hypothetical protein n=1 Tax=Streptomyces sp. NPDC056638 TaxID=3345887 RepID=UPI00367C1424